MRLRRLTVASVAIFAGLALAFCKKKDEADTDTFQRGPLLQNVADNYITPGYAAMQASLQALSDSWQTFLTNNDQASLDAVKNNCITADLVFQRIKMLECGPSMNLLFTESLGTFPTDTIKIESHITSGSYDLTVMDNFDSEGFDALDYLLFGNNALTNLQNSASRKNYTSAVIGRMLQLSNTLVTQWASYKSTFVAGTGNSSTDPFALFVNNYCKDYDYAKATKIAIPFGKTTLGIKKLPYLEMRRSKTGTQLLQANMSALRDLFNGNSWTGASGTGFDDYLVAVEQSDLSSTINSRLATLASTPAGWTDNLENMMVSQSSVIEDYYNYMSSTTVYMKTDMTSAFGVVITYQDNDGD